MNHWPTTAIPDGKTPRQLLLKFMNTLNPIPNLYALRKFGEPGWVHISEQRRNQGDKFLPRATKQYFVGREGSRIYLMWNPDTNKVTRTSSVKWVNAPLRKITDQNNINKNAPGNTGLQIITPSTPEPVAAPDSPELSSQVPLSRGEDETTIFQQLDVLLPETGQGLDNDLADYHNNLDSFVGRYKDRPASQHAPRHFDVSANMNPCLILDGKRVRKPTAKAAAVATTTHTTPLIVARKFALALTNTQSTHANNNTDSPPEPTSHKKAMIHKYKDGWILAEQEEYKAHDDNCTWTDSVTLPVGTFALPNKWVYKYKFNKSGKLTRLKAHLVVCGNCQDIDFWRETYAAVARATTLKALLAMVATLDLECHQADVVTAFLNGHLNNDEHIWIRLPDGCIVKVKKALYRLRRSPQLWYQELSRYLKSIGFNPIEVDPCVFINALNLIILAYVDDLVMITRTKAEMVKLKAQSSASSNVMILAQSLTT
jgi:hypothetical protein